MSKITINNITFNNVPNKKLGTKISTTITLSNIGVTLTIQNYVASEAFYKLLNAIDIDWNGIVIDNNTVINDTADLINWIKSIAATASNTDGLATESFVLLKINDLINGAGDAYDTLKEIADKLNENDDVVSALTLEIAEKTTKEMQGTNGTASIFNAVDGGGAKFEHNDGTLSYAGVKDGGKDGLAGQLYAVDSTDEFNGARLDITTKGMYYTVGKLPIAERDIPENEIATKDNINQAIINKVDKDSVYTKSEADNKFQEKGEYLTANDISTKADKDSVYTKAESDNKFETKLHVEEELLKKANNADISTLRTDISTNYYTNEEIDDKITASGIFDETQYYKKNQINTELLKYPLKTDISTNYYTKDEVDEAINNVDITEKISEYAKKADVSTELDKKANSADVYTKTDSDTSVKSFVQDQLSNYYDKDNLDASVANINSSINSVKTRLDNIDASWANYYSKEESDASIKAYALPKGDYLTSADIEGKADKSTTYTKEEADKKFTFDASIKNVAKTGSYNDLSDKPAIPSKISLLTNDSGFLTQNSLETYATKADVSANVNKAIEDLVGEAPATLDTLGEIAAALEDNAKLSDITEAIKTKANTADVSTELDKKADKSDTYTKTDIDNKLGDFGKTQDLTADKSAKDYIDDKVSSLNNELSTVAKTGSYNDLSDTPTDLGDFTNDAGYLKATDITDKADKTYVDSEIAKVTGQDVPEDFNTLKKISGKISNNINDIATINDTLLTKADSNNVYTKDEINGKLGNFGKIIDLEADGEHEEVSHDKSAKEYIDEIKGNIDTELNKKANNADLATVATTGSYNDLSDKPTIPTVDLTKALADELYQAKGEYYTKTEADALLGNKANSNDVYTKTEADNKFTNNIGTVTGISMNGNELTVGNDGKIDLGTVITAHQDISGKANTNEVYSRTDADNTFATKSDVSTVENKIPTAISDLTNDSGFATTTQLANKADIADVPSKISDLTNDSEFITADDLNTRISELIDGAPEALDTLKEIADQLADDSTAINSLVTTIATKANSADVYTKKTIDSSVKNYVQYELTTKYPTKTDISSSYYTKAEVESMITASGSFVAELYYTKTEADTSVENALNNYYTKADADTSVKNYVASELGSYYDIETLNTSINNNFAKKTSVYTKDEADSTFAAKTNLHKVATSGSYYDLQDTPNLVLVSITGDYNDLINKPTIPTKTSELTNDANYVDSTQLANKANSADVYTRTEINSLIGTLGNQQGDNTPATPHTVKSYVDEKISNLIGNAPATLDTLEEIAAVLNDDTNLSQIAAAIETKANASEVYKKTEIDQKLGDFGKVVIQEADEEHEEETRDRSAKEYIDGSILSLATVAKSGSYNDLSDKPTKLSDFTNDENFGKVAGIIMNGTDLTIDDNTGKINLGTVITEHQSLSDYAKIEDVDISLGIRDASITDIKTQLATINNTWDNYYDKTTANNTFVSQTTFDTLLNTNAAATIDTFNEIEAFLNGISDASTLTGILTTMQSDIATTYAAKTNVYSKTELDTLLNDYATVKDVVDNEKITATAISNINKKIDDNNEIINTRIDDVYEQVNENIYKSLDNYYTKDDISTYVNDILNDYATNNFVNTLYQQNADKFANYSTTALMEAYVTTAIGSTNGNAPITYDTTDDEIDLLINDLNNNTLVAFYNGEIRTKYFDSAVINTSVNTIMETLNSAGSEYVENRIGNIGNITEATENTYYTAEEAAAYNEEHNLSDGDEGYVRAGDIKTAGQAAVKHTVKSYVDTLLNDYATVNDVIDNEKIVATAISNIDKKIDDNEEIINERIDDVYEDINENIIEVSTNLYDKLSEIYTKEESDNKYQLKGNYYTTQDTYSKTETDNAISNAVANIIWSGTQEQYDALGTKNNDTLYIITDGIDDGNTINYVTSETLNTALSTKANSADVYTKSEIDTTVTILDTSINNNDSSIVSLIQTVNQLSTALDQALARILALENANA